MLLGSGGGGVVDNGGQVSVDWGVEEGVKMGSSRSCSAFPAPGAAGVGWQGWLPAWGGLSSHGSLTGGSGQLDCPAWAFSVSYAALSARLGPGSGWALCPQLPGSWRAHTLPLSMV